MIRYYDPYAKEYAWEAKASLQTYGWTLFFALVLIGALTYCFIRIGLRKENVGFGTFTASAYQSTTFTSALLGFLCLVIAVFLLLYLPLMLVETTAVYYQYAQLTAYVLLFFSAAYFLINAAGSAHLTKAKKVLAFAPPLWAVALLLATYMDPMYLYRDFNHLLCIASVALLMFFFLYDSAACATGKIREAYLPFSLLSIIASMAYIVPNFILLAYWELANEMNFIFEAVEIGALIYAITVAYQLIRSIRSEIEVEEPYGFTEIEETEN